ncbi:MAG: hypothetical protein IKR48_06980 [Kiritimatiellae bacterium]|nr:hypothetical protein [Kiritimatiellia bacterium]
MFPERTINPVLVSVRRNNKIVLALTVLLFILSACMAVRGFYQASDIAEVRSRQGRIHLEMATHLETSRRKNPIRVEKSWQRCERHMDKTCDMMNELRYYYWILPSVISCLMLICIVWDVAFMSRRVKTLQSEKTDTNAPHSKANIWRCVFGLSWSPLRHTVLGCGMIGFGIFAVVLASWYMSSVTALYQKWESDMLSVLNPIIEKLEILANTSAAETIKVLSVWISDAYQLIQDMCTDFSMYVIITGIISILIGITMVVIGMTLLRHFAPAKKLKSREAEK